MKHSAVSTSGRIKSIVKRVAFAVPFVRRFYLGWKLRRNLRQAEDLHSVLSSNGHALDHCLSRGQRPDAAMVTQTESAFRMMRRLGVPVNSMDMWAAGLLSVTRFRLQENYRRSVESEAGGTKGSEDASVCGGSAELDSVIRSRRSVRRWKDADVGDERLRTIVSAASWAPCSCNRQSWRVLCVRNEGDKEFLRQFYTAGHNHFWAKAPVVLVVLMNPSLYSEADMHYTYLDAGAFIQNLLLAAHAEGLGACWVGFTAWDVFDNLRVTAEARDAFYTRFDCSGQGVPVSLIGLGEPLIVPKAPPRRRPDEILFGASKDGCGE